MALGVAIALATAWPLLPVLATAIPAPAECDGVRCADQALVLWLMTQAGRNLYANPLTLFEAPVFHPLRHALAYSESMLSAAAAIGPLERLTGSPIVAYNVHYLATIVLSVAGMYLLVREITADRVAALVAGGLFGLATERELWWIFPPALAVHWAPVLLWAWLRFLGGPSWRRGFGLGLALIAHAHASAYHGLMLPVLLVPWALALALFGPWSLRRWLASVVPLAVAGIVAAALYYPYLVVKDELGYEPRSMAIALPDQYWTGVVDPMAYVAWRVDRPHEGFLVSPLAWWVLAAAALAVLARRRVPGPPRLGVQLGAMLVVAALAMLVSLGPALMTPLGLVPGPLALLRELPGFGAMRAVGRFTMLAAFARAAVAGIAMSIVLARLPPAVGRAAAAVVLLLALADARPGTARPVNDFVTIPAARAKGYAWLTGTLPGTPIVEFPYGGWGGEARAMVYALSHRRPIMNGYSAVMPNFADTVNRLPEDVAWRTLQEAGVQYVLAHPTDLLAHPLTAPRLRRLRHRHDLLVAELDDTLVFAVPPASRSPEPPLGEPVPRDGWRFRSRTPGLGRALDGDLTTHWVTTTGRRESIRLDLGREADLSAIVLAFAAHVLDYPRRYVVWGSRDGRGWTRLGGENPTIPPLAAYRRDHRDVRMRLRITPARVRFVRFGVPRSRGWHAAARWGIHEILVYESPLDESGAWRAP